MQIKTTFGFNSTAEEVIKGIRLDGKRAIVTGGASGIGLETVRTLAKAGAKVTIAARNQKAASEIADEINMEAKNVNVTVSELDLANLASIQHFLSNWTEPLDLLVNNAGVMALPELQKTAAGIEMQFMTNYLGHFALTLGLYEFLKNADAARIVIVSSSGHLLSPVVFDDISFSFRPYEKLQAYGQSKTACNLFAVEVTRRWAKDGIFANALNPGAILTNLQRHVGNQLSSSPEFHKTAQQGAATTILLATSPLLEGIGGRYFENCNEAAMVDERPPNYQGVAAYSLSQENAIRLWDTSIKLLDK